VNNERSLVYRNPNRARKQADLFRFEPMEGALACSVRVALNKRRARCVWRGMIFADVVSRRQKRRAR
jgi:hypothetical protein